MKAVVTGGLGFIGSHLVEKLLGRGDEVTVLDDLSSGRKENLSACEGSSRLKVVERDVRKPEGLAEMVSGADAVVHLAAVVSVERSISDPALVFDVNVGGTVNVLRACKEGRVGRVVFASSAAVYGRGAPPLKESSPLVPLSPYAASKVSGEAYCGAFARSYGLGAAVLRFFNVYGPRSAPGPYAGVTNAFARALIDGSPLVVYGDGEQTRDLVHVGDAVDAVLLALSDKAVPGEAFNVGTGEGTTINGLAALFRRLGGGGAKVVHVEARSGEVRESVADIGRAREVLGFTPKISLERGVSDYLAWSKEEASRR